MQKLAIIPARGGSKRIPQKNIKLFLGKPLILYTIEAALESQLFDRVMVSTDCEQIAQLSRDHGADIPFLRSEKASNDFASTEDVLLEVLSYYQNQGENFDLLCCLYPTAPFLTGQKIKNAFLQLEKYKADNCLTMTKFSYPPQRGLIKTNRDERVQMWQPENEQKRSQDLAPIYHDAGQLYWAKVEVFLQSHSLFTPKTVALELSALEVQDIDEPSDWELAELKYQYWKKS